MAEAENKEGGLERIDPDQVGDKIGEKNYLFSKKTLGEGASCSVLVATKKDINKKVAVKRMVKTKRVHEKMYNRETKLLHGLNHPNIVVFVEGFETKKDWCVVTGMCEGGELFDRIVDPKNHMTEGDVKRIIQQMLDAIHHIHNKNIVHRDLKPENFIFQTKAKDSPIVLIDFGTAMKVEDDGKYKDFAGTPFYLAPESASSRPYRTGKMLKSSDIWAIGVITFICLTGSPPFYGDTNKKICKAICNNDVTWPKKAKGLSDAVKEFVYKTLRKRWKKRMTLDDAMQSSWILGEGQNTKITRDALRSLRQFNYQSKLKKAVAGILSVNMGDGPQMRVKEHFKNLDRDGDNKLDKTEIIALFSKVGYGEDTATMEADRILSEADEDGDGVISLKEFEVVWQRKLLSVNDAYIKAVFGVLDGDRDGCIDANELAGILKKSKEEVAEIIKEADTNGDGKIQFKEFKDAMKERLPEPPTQLSKADLAPHKDDIEEMQNDEP